MTEIQKYKKSDFEMLLEKVGILVGLSSKVNTLVSTVISEFLAEFYKGITLIDVDLAFKMLISGKLDEFLPLDKHSMPDRGHYGEMSAAYVSKVLDAFIKHNNRYKPKKAKKLLSKVADSAEKERIAKRRKENLEHLDNQIIEQFDCFVKNDFFDFLIYYPVLLRLKEVDLLDNLPECTESPLQIALQMARNLKMSTPEDRLHMNSKGANHPKVKSLAKVAGDLLIIKQVFQKLKDEGRHIGEFLKR